MCVLSGRMRLLTSHDRSVKANSDDPRSTHSPLVACSIRLDRTGRFRRAHECVLSEPPEGSVDLRAPDAPPARQRLIKPRVFLIGFSVNEPRTYPPLPPAILELVLQAAPPDPERSHATRLRRGQKLSAP